MIFYWYVPFVEDGDVPVVVEVYDTAAVLYQEQATVASRILEAFTAQEGCFSSDRYMCVQASDV